MRSNIRPQAAINNAIIVNRLAVMTIELILAKGEYLIMKKDISSEFNTNRNANNKVDE